LPLLLALWTGQRQGDLLRLPWSCYDEKHVRLRQSKTGTRVIIPIGEPLKIKLDATPKRSTIILTNRTVDIGRLPGVMGQGLQGGWRRRRDL
jgi:integrase